jgi:hypothetical protein
MMLVIYNLSVGNYNGSLKRNTLLQNKESEEQIEAEA